MDGQQKILPSYPIKQSKHWSISSMKLKKVHPGQHICCKPGRSSFPKTLIKHQTHLRIGSWRLLQDYIANGLHVGTGTWKAGSEHGIVMQSTPGYLEREPRMHGRRQPLPMSSQDSKASTLLEVRLMFISALTKSIGNSSTKSLRLPACLQES